MLKFHAFGLNDNLKIIKQKYNIQRNSIIENKKLNETERKIELLKLEESFVKERIKLSNNLYLIK